MKIAIVGCGAVGSYYGAKLWKAGQQVHFLLRSDYEVVKREGVRILSVEGDFVAHPVPHREPEEIGPCDWVVVALKTTANKEFGRLIPPLVGDQTRVITLQNGLGNEEALAEVVGAERVYGGLCFVCLNRIAPGVIRHMAHGRIVMGEFRRRPGPAIHELAELFREAGVPCEVSEDLERAHWEKLVWNIPFNGLGVAGVVGYENYLAGEVPPPEKWGPCLTTEDILGDSRWLDQVKELMGEVLAAAKGLGFSIPWAFARENIERTRCMGPYKASTLLDFERGLPLEMESLFLEPRRRAHRVGVSTPGMDRLCRVLEQLDKLRAEWKGGGGWV